MEYKIKLPFKLKKPVLAFGSQTKNSICFAKAGFAYLSSMHRDLNNPDDYSAFEKEAGNFLKKNPKVFAYDLHPEYQSTKFALSRLAHTALGLAVQHHHSHIASCMVDNGLKNQKVIGVAFDGTGLGADDTIWGAEFLICDYKGFKRKAHLKEIPLLGGEKAISEPWRTASAWLYLIYKDKFLNLEIDFSRGIDKKSWQVLKKMYLSGLNSPLASSMGRLFDAAASLILAKHKAGFEAELAIELERLASSYKSRTDCYGFRMAKDGYGYILDPGPAFKDIIRDLKTKVAKEKIAYRFHLTVAQMILKTALALKRESGLKKVVLSGGVFQNSLLLNLTLALLYKHGFSVFIHRKLSCNDSGISLGQAAIAGQRS